MRLNKVLGTILLVELLIGYGLFAAAQSPSGAYSSPSTGSVTAVAIGAACGTTGQLIYNNAGSCAGTTATWDTTNSRFLAPNGSVSLPGYSFTGNPSTGLFFNGSSAWGLSIGGINNLFATTTGVTINGAGQTFTAPLYLTATNCASSASPAVCGAAAAGSFNLPAAATTVTVNTTAVTANSQIFVVNDDSLGTRLSVTCNTALDQVFVSARVAGTSFTITGTAPVTNPNCYSYYIVN